MLNEEGVIRAQRDATIGDRLHQIEIQLCSIQEDIISKLTKVEKQSEGCSTLQQSTIPPLGHDRKELFDDLHYTDIGVGLEINDIQNTCEAVGRYAVNDEDSPETRTPTKLNIADITIHSVLKSPKKEPIYEANPREDDKGMQSVCNISTGGTSQLQQPDEEESVDVVFGRKRKLGPHLKSPFQGIDIKSIKAVIVIFEFV